jgi:hypothetical protein
MDTKDGGGNKPGGAVANGSNNSSSSSSASRENSAEDNNYLLIGDLRKLNSESVHLSAMALSRLRHRYPAEKMFGGSGHQDKPTKTPPVVNPRPNSSKNAV